MLSSPQFAEPKTANALKERIRREGRERICWFEHIKGTTQQPLLPAFSLVVSRAGGGIVNDCLAARVPLVCLPEKQVQVVLIESECLKAGLIPALSRGAIERFRKDAPGFVEEQLSKGKERRLAPMPAGMEVGLAEDILVWLQGDRMGRNSKSEDRNPKQILKRGRRTTESTKNPKGERKVKPQMNTD